MSRGRDQEKFCFDPFKLHHTREQNRSATPLSANDLQKVREYFSKLDIPDKVLMCTRCRMKALTAHKLKIALRQGLQFAQKNLTRPRSDRENLQAAAGDLHLVVQENPGSDLEGREAGDQQGNREEHPEGSLDESQGESLGGQDVDMEDIENSVELGELIRRARTCQVTDQNLENERILEETGIRTRRPSPSAPPQSELYPNLETEDVVAGPSWKAGKSSNMFYFLTCMLFTDFHDIYFTYF